MTEKYIKVMEIKQSILVRPYILPTPMGNLELHKALNISLKKNDSLGVYEIYAFIDDIYYFINDFPDRMDTANFLSYLSVCFNHSRLDYKYTKDFEEWFVGNIN